MRPYRSPRPYRGVPRYGTTGFPIKRVTGATMLLVALVAWGVTRALDGPSVSPSRSAGSRPPASLVHLDRETPAEGARSANDDTSTPEQFSPPPLVVPIETDFSVERAPSRTALRSTVYPASTDSHRDESRWAWPSWGWRWNRSVTLVLLLLLGAFFVFWAMQRPTLWAVVARGSISPPSDPNLATTLARIAQRRSRDQVAIVRLGRLRTQVAGPIRARHPRELLVKTDWRDYPSGEAAFDALRNASRGRFRVVRPDGTVSTAPGSL